MATNPHALVAVDAEECIHLAERLDELTPRLIQISEKIEAAAKAADATVAAAEVAAAHRARLRQVRSQAERLSAAATALAKSEISKD